jgi:hypothetical protein
MLLIIVSGWSRMRQYVCDLEGARGGVPRRLGGVRAGDALFSFGGSGV